MKWEVKRKLSDFIWLRNTLTKIYPGIVIPYLSENKSGELNTPEYFSKMISYLNVNNIIFIKIIFAYFIHI